MASAKTVVNPYLRRTPGQRLAGLGKSIIGLPGLAVKTFRGWPRPFRRLVLGLFVVGLALFGWQGGKYLTHRADKHKMVLEWIAIEEIRRTSGDRAQLLEHLDKILAIDPDDARAKNQKAVLESGQGDPADTRLMQIIILDHLRHQRYDEVRRECEKRLVFEPRDYFCHYLLAKLYLMRNEPQAAEAHLNAIADPGANPVELTIDAVRDSRDLLTQLQRDTLKLRTFVSDYMINQITKTQVANGEPELQWKILDLFADTFRLPKVPTGAGQTWIAANEIAGFCLQGALRKESPEVARQLGRLGPSLADALLRTKNVGQIGGTQYDQLAEENEDRTRKAWAYVLGKEPKNAEAYFGIIWSHARSRHPVEANDALVHGLEACGDDPKLLELFTNQRVGTSDSLNAYRRLIAAAERNPTVPRYWFMAAHAALAAGRRDLALQSLETARKSLPNDTDIQIKIAEAYSGTGHPEKVLAAFAAIRDDDLATNFVPHAGEIFARALAEIGDEERLDHYLTVAYEASRRTNRPHMAAAAAAGLLEATPASHARAAKAAEYLYKVVEQWRREYPAATVLLADALAKACELKPGPFDAVAAKNAILACERALIEADPNHTPTVAALVRLRLRADRNAAKAMDEASPLIARIDRLAPDQVEALAMAYNANRRFADALRLLESYSTSNVTAGCWVQMALALQGQSRNSEAITALNRAGEMSMTERERADYLAARELLSRVKS